MNHSNILEHFEDDSAENSIKTLEIFIEFIFKVASNHHKDADVIPEDRYGKIILQMIFTKLYHIKQSFEGIDYPGLNKIKDPSLISNNIRNLFEMIAVFNLFFVKSNSNEEKKLKLLIWDFCSLSYNTSITKVTDELLNSKFEESNENKINVVRNKIENNIFYESLGEAERTKIQKIIKYKEFKISMTNGVIKKLSWQDIADDFPDSKKILDKKYTYLSFFSHPSHLSVEQFSRTYSNEDKMWIELSAYNIKDCFLFTSIFLADYISVFPNVINTYNEQSDLNKFVINFYNVLVRGETFSIK